MDFTVGLIASMGGLIAIVLVLIAASPGTLEGATEMLRMDSIPKLDRVSEEIKEGLELEKREQPSMMEEKQESMVEEIEEMIKPEMEHAPQTHTVSLPEGSSLPECAESNECYIPDLVTINEGDTVVWSNDDLAAHTVTSGSPAKGPDGLFDSSLFMAGNTFKFTFEEEGMYDYFCVVHPWMVGSVKVVDSEEIHEDMREEMEHEIQEEKMEKEMGAIKEIEEKKGMMAEPAPMATTVSLAVGSGAPGCEKTDECYIPYIAKIAKGGTVTWSNDDTAAHTVTSGTANDGPDGLFDSNLFMAGNTFEFTFEELGEYDYFCMVHPWMTGKVNVS